MAMAPVKKPNRFAKAPDTTLQAVKQPDGSIKAVPVEASEVSALPGVNVLLMGPGGTGKTFSIGTLVDLGMDVFFFAFESGSESLRGYWTDRGLEVPPNLHMITVKSPNASWVDMAQAAGMVNKLSYEALKKQNDPKKRQYNQFEQFLLTFNNIVDDAGNTYGSVDDLGLNAAVVIDGLTGLSNAALKTVVGGKLDRDQKDWGLGQNLIEFFLRKLCDDCNVHVVLITHVEREVDEVLGGVKIMPSTLGKKLPPKLSPIFSDVILATRNSTNWLWDTASPQADVKTRNLPIRSDNPQDFGTIIKKWESRGGRR